MDETDIELMNTVRGIDRAAEIYLCDDTNNPHYQELVGRRIHNLVEGVYEYDNLTNGGTKNE